MCSQRLASIAQRQAKPQRLVRHFTGHTSRAGGRATGRCWRLEPSSTISGCEAPNRTRRIDHHRHIRWIGRKPIHAPLGHIAMHVFQAETVGCPQSHWVHCSPAVACVPGHAVKCSAEGTGNSPTACQLPLCLAGQIPDPSLRKMALMALLFCQPTAEFAGLLPRDLGHRQFHSPDRAGIGLHERQPLPLRQFGLSDEKPGGQLHSMLRFVDQTPFLLGWAAHDKTRCWNPTHCHRTGFGQRRQPTISGETLGDDPQHLTLRLRRTGTAAARDHP